MFWRNMIFQTTVYCKYHITDLAFVRIVFHVLKKHVTFQNMFSANMSFQIYVLCKYEITEWAICKIYFSHDLKKYDLSSLYLLHISHHRLDIFKICFGEIWPFKLMFSANITSQIGICKVYISHVLKKYDISN
jgi:hypothetical protein